MEKRSQRDFGRKFKLVHLIIVALVVMVVTDAATYIITIGGFSAQKYFEDAKAYVEIEKIINENYIGDVNDDTLYNAAASAMVRSIDDKWSYYMSPEEYAAYKLSSSNEYAGIGVSVKLNDKGKLDVSGAVGKDGFLTVIKDLGLKEPYVGQVPIVSGEIAEDITNYFATSEQIPTVCALGVLVNPDLTIRKAGGFIIQLLPTADDTIIDKVEKCISDIEPVTTMLDKGLSPETICRTVLPAFKLDVLDTSEPEYRCNCSRERVSRALISMGRDELEKLKDDEKTEVCCQFCDKKYVFTPADIDRLLEESKGKEDK